MTATREASLPRRRRTPRPGHDRDPTSSPLTCLLVLHAAADAVATALHTVDDWGLAGTRPGQHHSDLAPTTPRPGRALERRASASCARRAGCTTPTVDVHRGARPARRLDERRRAASPGTPRQPVRGRRRRARWPRSSSTWSTGERYEAVRGGGARRDGSPIAPSGATGLGARVVGLSGYPPRSARLEASTAALGAVALDLCAVADGRARRLRRLQPRRPRRRGTTSAACWSARRPARWSSTRSTATSSCCEHAARRTPVAAATPELLGGAPRGPALVRVSRLVAHLVIDRIHRLLLRVFRRLPRRARSRLRCTPSPRATRRRDLP